MVADNDEQKRSRAEYSLNRVRELASNGAVRYGSNRVFLDTENLEYAPSDVHQCLACLEQRNYRGSVRYAGQRFWWDEYLITYVSPSGHQDDLYIKLKLDRDCITVVLGSFHEERWL